MITKTFLRLIRFGVPFYQSLDELGISGTRDTSKRFSKYGLKSILKDEHSVLDIGCNTGFFSIMTSGFVKSVDAFDNKFGNVLTGQIAMFSLGVKNVRLFRSSIEEFSTSNVYNIVYSFAVHHWISLSFKEYAQKLSGLDKPGG